MNNQPPDNDPQQPRLDQTYIEGAGGQPQQPGLAPGARMDATSVGGQNPYAQRAYGQLPDDGERVQMGSGTVVGVLGSGGMAKIYKIFNDKLEVYRAIKILLPSHQKDLMERFETEAKITAKLHHQNIVEIYTVGEWNGLPFLEMEFIDGVSLDSVINSHGKLPPSVCTAIGVLIARALAYAHSQEFLLYGKNYKGVIHRDLKPANIMISKNGNVKLMDFGIARPTETSLHTVDGNIVGTMQYLSPEQLDSGDIDCRTDIYSFGAILYEMLTGTKTFPQKTITNLLKNKSMNQYRKFAEFPFVVPPPLAKISQKCLQHSAGDRFDNAEDLLSSLEKAHSALADDSAERTVSLFLKAPDEFAHGKKKTILHKILSPKAAFAAAGIAVIAIAAGLLYLTRPDLPDKLKEAEQQQAEKAVIAAKPVRPAEIKTPAPKPEPAEKTKPASKPKPKPAPRRTVRRRKPAKPKLSPLEDVKARYNSSDMLSIGKQALNKGQSADAIIALKAIPPGGASHKKASIYLLEAYIRSGQVGNARKQASTISANDAHFDFLRGKMEEKSNNLGKALSYYQSALTKPTVTGNIGEIRKDALYHSALIYDKQYKKLPTPDARLKALNGWNIVKRTYSSNPNHPRFKMANSKLATMR